MKDIYYEVKITNYIDLEMEAKGLIKPEEVRSITLKAKIDTGATHLSLPEEIAQKLGMRKIEIRNVRYANGAIEEKWLGSVVEVKLKDRTARVSPIIENKDTKVLIGNPVLEDMDLYINTKTGEIYPNPESPDKPLAELMMKDVLSNKANENEYYE